jgi:hypothetical protein
MGVQINGSTGNVIATKGTFSGNVGIAGTLTYEDVTDIDAVGLITARSGIEVGASPGVGASISRQGNAIFSGITTIGSKEVGAGITLSPDGHVSVSGVTTSSTIHIGVDTGVYGENLVVTGTSRVTGIASFGTSNSSSMQVNIGMSTLSAAPVLTVPDMIKHSGDPETRIRFDTGIVKVETTKIERLRVGPNGQLGISGANYGTSGQVLTSQGSSSAVQWATPASATSGTYTSVGTGYYKDITTTSTNVVKYDIMFTGVSIGGGMEWQFQLGDSGGVESSGYNTVSAYRSHNVSNKTSNPSNAFRWYGIGDASYIMDGRFTLTRIHNNKWFGEGLLLRTEAGSTIYDMIGTKELSGALTTIRISSSYDDSEVFDGGHYKVIEYTGTV